jgi:hypothetical protein
MSENVVDDRNKTASINSETSSVYSSSVCNNTSRSENSCEIILKQKNQVKRSTKEKNCFNLFVFFYYVKYYVKKLKLCFLIFFLTIFFIISSLLLLIAVFNVYYCFKPDNHKISVYLIVFAITSILRILLYISCPFSYDKHKNCFQCKFNFCLRVKKFKGIKKTKPRVKSKPSLIDNSAINFISRKFSETTEINRKSSANTLIHNNPRCSDECRRLNRYNTKYKFIDCNSIRYACAILIQRTIDLFLLCWFICGNYFVFSNPQKLMNPNNNNTDHVHEKKKFYIFNTLIQIQEFCDNFSSQNVALVQIISFYALFAFLIIFYVLFSTCKLIYGVLKKRYEKKNEFNFV